MQPLLPPLFPPFSCRPGSPVLCNRIRTRMPPPLPTDGGSGFRWHLIWLLQSVSTPLLKSSHTGFCVPGARNNLAEPGVNHHTKKKALQSPVSSQREVGRRRTREVNFKRAFFFPFLNLKKKKRSNASRCLAAFNCPSKLLW